MTSGPDIDVLTKTDEERNFPIKLQTIPKTVRIWDDLHKRWFQGGTSAKQRRLETDAVHFFGEIMIFGEVFHDQNEDGAWKGMGVIEMLDHLIVVQDTGVTDQDGRHVFEGDIIQDSEHGYLSVAMYDAGEYVGVDPVDDTINDSLYLLARDGQVVGNIFDNPELLEEEPMEEE